MRAAQQFHNPMEQTRASFMALVGPRDIANDDADAQRGRPHANGRNRSEGATDMTRHRSLPLLLGQPRVGFSRLSHRLVNGLSNRIRVDAGGNRDFDLVPQPLPGGGEVEVMALDGKAVHDLAADSVDFDPVAWANAVRAH